MQQTKDQRGTVTARTLQHLEDQLEEFKDKGQGDLRNATKFFNVIHEPLISIPIDQVNNFSMLILAIHKNNNAHTIFYSIILYRYVSLAFTSVLECS